MKTKARDIINNAQITQVLREQGTCQAFPSAGVEAFYCLL